MLNHASSIEPRAVVDVFDTYQKMPIRSAAGPVMRRIRWRYPDAVADLAVLLSDVMGAREASVALSLPLSTVYRWIRSRSDDGDPANMAAHRDDLAELVRGLVERCADEGCDVPTAALRRWADDTALKMRARLACVSAVRQNRSNLSDERAASNASSPDFSLDAPPTAHQTQLSARGVDRAKEAMEQNCCEPWRARQLADIAGFSRFTFARKFVAAFGVSPHQFLLSLRVQRAYAMLKTSERTLDKVAAAAGFGSSSSMHRAFKRFLGASPAKVFCHRVERPATSSAMKPFQCYASDAARFIP